MSSRQARALPIGVLIALTLFVLLAHLAVLQAPPLAMGLSPPPAQPLRAFQTRTIQPDPTPTTPARPAAKAVTRPANAPIRQVPIAPAPASGTLLGHPATDVNPVPAPPPSADNSDTASMGEPVSLPGVPTLNAQARESDPVPVPRPPRDVIPALNANALPGSARLSYRVEANKFPFTLNSELRWSNNNQSYEARLEFSAFGQSRVQTSQGAITPEGLSPLRFSDKFRNEVAAHFDRPKGKVTFSANTPDVALLAGAQDRLSILVQLAAMIASNPGAYAEATTIAIQTIGPRDADIWLFTVGQQENLSLPNGEETGLKLVRNPRKEFDQRVELWLAPAIGYLPVRIRITEAGGAYIDQKWLGNPAQTQPSQN